MVLTATARAEPVRMLSPVTSLSQRAIPGEGAAGLGEVLVPDSKVRRPRRRTGTLIRSDLITRLGDPEHDVILVLAPAGFGKTTVVSQWVDASHVPVAWVTSSASDRDPVVLMSTLLVAIQGAGVTVDLPTGVLTGDEPAFTRRVLPQFEQALANVASPVTLVIEDIHVLDSDAAAVVLVATIDALPVGSRVVLVGRSRPDLPIHLWGGQGRVLEIGPNELAFDRTEVRLCLSEHLGRQPSRDELILIHSRSEGWPVAVYLEAMTLKRRETISESTPRSIEDYVRSEVTAGLNSDLTSFLRHTSILTSQSGPLCDHVLEAIGSGERLAQAEAATLLVGRLEGPGGWYRTHPLLREALAADFTSEDPTRARRLHARAAQWYHDRHQSDEALLHAIASEDPDLIAGTGWDYGIDALLLGRTTSVRAWLDRVPLSDIETTAGLALLAAWTGVVGGDSAAAQNWTEAALRSYGPDWIEHLDRSPREPALALLICLSGTLEHAQAAALAGAAADALPVSNRTRPLSVLLKGWHLALAGAVDDGIERLHDSHALAMAFGIGTNAVEAPALLGYIYESRGDLKTAKAMAASARETWETHDLQDAAPATGLLYGLETFLHARDRPLNRTRADLDTTSRIAEQLVRMMPAPAALIDAYVARTWASLGERTEAAEALDRATRTLSRLPHSDWLSNVIDTARADVELNTPLAQLSPAQRRVLEQLATDQTLNEIAAALHVSHNTVKAHTRDIYRTLGVNSRRAAVRLAASPNTTIKPGREAGAADDAR